MISIQLTLARFLFFVSFAIIVSAQPAPNTVPLSVDDVVKMSQGGFPEDIIITRIKKNGKPFDLSTDELTEIRKLGVTDNVIKYLVDPTQSYAPPPVAPAPPPNPADR